MTTDWQKLVIKNFDEASCKYNEGANLQICFAKRLAEQCTKKFIPPGLWVDLGSGTGLLANELEKRTPNQSVLRVDGSERMLNQHPKNKSTKLFDLNSGLPHLEESPTLIASSFALHWLKQPEQKIHDWFAALAPGGWLALALPVRGSFPEWHNAATQANVKCTAMEFPSHKSLINVITKTKIRFHKLETFTEEAATVSSLLKSLKKVGGHSSPLPSLRVSEWRKIQKSWAISNHKNVPQLTWLIQMLLAQK